MICDRNRLSVLAAFPADLGDGRVSRFGSKYLCNKVDESLTVEDMLVCRGSHTVQPSVWPL